MLRGLLPGNAGNEEQLEASMDIEVRQRSSDFLAVDILGPRGAVIYLINLATGDLVPLSDEIETNEFIEGLAYLVAGWFQSGIFQ